MCFTLMQHYIGCGHTDVHFIDCDDHEWNPSSRFDGLTSESRDHSVQKGVAHSYRRRCPACERAAKVRDIRRVERQSVRAWRTFAERHQEADNGSESDSDESRVDEARKTHITEVPFGNFSVDPGMNCGDVPDLPVAKREARDGEVTTRLFERWTQQREAEATASTLAHEQSLSGQLSGLSAAHRSSSWERKIFPTWQDLQSGPKVPMQQALENFYERMVASCLVRTPIIGSIRARTASGIIERTMSNACHRHPLAVMWLPALLWSDTDFDCIFKGVRTATDVSDGRVPTYLYAIFLALLHDYRISRDLMAGDADYDDAYCSENGYSRTIQLEIQILLLAWYVVMLHHVRLAAQLVGDVNGAVDSRSPERQEAILNLGSGSYIHFIRGLTADDLITAAELAVGYELSRPSTSNSPGGPPFAEDGSMLERTREVRLGQDGPMSSVADTSQTIIIDHSPQVSESGRVLTDLPLYLAGPLRKAMSPPHSGLPYQYPEATSLKARYCEGHASSCATHARNVFSRKSPNCIYSTLSHGDRPKPVTSRDHILSSTVRSTLFYFAGCEHYNAVRTEELRLDDDQATVVAQCGCFEFPNKLLMEQRAFSLRSCLFCERRSAWRHAKRSAVDSWTGICLKQRARLVTSIREIDCWPLELC